MDNKFKLILISAMFLTGCNTVPQAVSGHDLSKERVDFSDRKKDRNGIYSGPFGRYHSPYSPYPYLHKKKVARASAHKSE